MSQPNLLPTPTEMVAYLDRFVRGQARAKLDLVVGVYNHYLSQAHRDLHAEDLGRFHILLLGPTGSGKTYLVKKLAECLKVPVSFASATSLVEVGYRGRSVDDIVKSLLDRADGNPRLAERGILFIDEIDKIRRSNDAGRDVSGEGVQNALLTLLDGRIAEQVDSTKHAPIDTSRILFVCTGAFVGLEEIVKRRLGKQAQRVGFHPRNEQDRDALSEQPIYGLLSQALTADLVEFGMIPEFVGRFATITALHELGLADMRAIVGESTEASALLRQKALARIHGIELELSSDALDLIAAEAHRLGTGARGLHRLIGSAVDSVDHRWPELAAQGIHKVVIDAACMRGEREPRLIAGEPTQPRTDLQLREHCLNTLPPAPSGPFKGPPPKGISDASAWSDEKIRTEIERIKEHHLEWAKTTGSPRKWWLDIEKQYEGRPATVLRLAEELRNRKASVTEFFLAYVYSNTENIEANLHYLDYRRLKAEHDAKKRPAPGSTP